VIAASLGTRPFHFQDCQKGALDKVAKWMKTNHVQRCINHPLQQSRAKNEEERRQILENYAHYEGRIDRFCIVFPEEVNRPGKCRAPFLAPETR